MSLEIVFNKTFLKEMSKLPKGQRKKIEHFIFTEINKYNSIKEITKLEKLAGYKNYYKIRFGNYRAGIRITGNQIFFERILHRKDIYKYYP